MSVSKDVKKYVDETVKTFGKIDMFYNNAGISGPGTRFADNTIEEIEQVVGINLLGALYGIKYVLEVMLKNDGGSIVNTSSTAGLVGQETVGTYSATRSEEHTSELQSRGHLVCRLLLEKKNE